MEGLALQLPTRLPSEVIMGKTLHAYIGMVVFYILYNILWYSIYLNHILTALRAFNKYCYRVQLRLC